MNEKLRKGLKVARNIGLIGLVATGIGSCTRKCNRMQERVEAELAQPTNVVSRIYEDVTPVNLYHPKSHMSITRYIIDVNGDGIADAIQFAGSAALYTDDWQGYKISDAVKMSPELRKMASDYMALGKQLSKLIYEEEFKVKLPEVKK